MTKMFVNVSHRNLCIMALLGCYTEAFCREISIKAVVKTHDVGHMKFWSAQEERN